MPSEMTDIATRFVDLVLKYKQWNKIETLSTEELQVLFETVSAAGFDSKEVIPGKLVGYILEQDGSRTGETYPINSFCLFKVVYQENLNHYPATGWLDCAFRRVVGRMEPTKKNREELIEMIATEIERSIPLKPVQLTSEDDLLCECPPRRDSSDFVDHTRDDHRLNSCVGVHEVCDNWMDRTRTTKTHDAIVCRGCHLRVVFPNEVETYGDLRQALAA